MSSLASTLVVMVVSACGCAVECLAQSQPPIISDELLTLSRLTFEFDPAAQDTPATAPIAGEISDERGDAFKPFGTADTLRWNVIGSLSSNFKDATVPQAQLGLSYFIAPYLSLDVTADMLYASQDGPDALGAGVTLLFRWHFVHRETWTIYADGGAGLLFSTEDIPDDTARINFTPQIGVGATVDVSADTRLMLGVRWYHISSANTSISNEGRDHMMAYIGLSFPWGD